MKTLKIIILLFFCTLSAISCNKKLSPEKYYDMGNLRISKSDNNVKMFSFFIDNEFIIIDKSKYNELHTIMTKNEVLLLEAHLRKKEYCINEKNKILFVITGKQEEVFQEVISRDGELEKINITPIMFTGQCI